MVPQGSGSVGERGVVVGSKTFLSVDDMASELGLSPVTVYRWLRTGRGPRYAKLPNGVIRIRRSDLEKWYSEFENNPPE
ncbi:helix-turn-helix domain-containing protein [Actinocorallia sp. API 0066]|uniref:helix-turn-helix transcriptional regulator n=1 Tax=Actinocorallia sp. API 0066 TaxID=2896846 RepID=UPI0027DED31F|nr:helix-turn-helix domain-containing protein [Actinocorallia sp. API 0066]